MRVLIAHDGSAGAQIAADLARQIAWPAGSALKLVGVLADHVPPLPSWSTAEDARALVGAATSRLDLHLERVAQAFDGQQWTVERAVVSGRPGTAIVEQAEAFEADVVMAGTRGHGPIASLLLGSVAREIVDQAPCPVLIARSPVVGSVVVATDGSAFSAAAVDLVATWPVFEGVRVHVVSVASDLPRYTGLPGGDTIGMSSARTARQRIADADAMRLLEAGRSAAPEVLFGDPAAQIVGAAGAHGAGLIVIGSRGHGGIKRVLLGSVARNVLLTAHASSVLVVHGRHEGSSAVSNDAEGPA